MSIRWERLGAAIGLVAGVLAAVRAASSLPPAVKIGAIFTEQEKNGPNELAFKYAIHKINKDKTLLPYTSLVYDIQYVPRDDSFHASKKACQLVRYGVHAIFGPSDPLLGAHIHSICDALDIPHIEARLDVDGDVREFSINLHPTQYLLNNAFQDVMAFLNWTRIAVIYEKDYGLLKLRELVGSSQNGGLEIHLRQASPDSYQEVLLEIKNKEIHNIVIDTKPVNLSHFLKGILQLQMNDYKYHYLFTTFDLEAIDLEDFKYNFVNITAFRIVDNEDLSVKETIRNMLKFQPNRELRATNGTYIQAYITKILVINGHTYGVKENGEVVEIDENGNFRNVSKTSYRYDDLCLVAPLGDYVVALRENVYLDLFKTETGELVSEYKLKTSVNSINANPCFPYLTLCAKPGYVDLISLYKPEKLSLMTSMHLSHNTIQKIKYFEKGRLLATAFLDDGEIFIIEGLPGTQMRVVGHVIVNRQVLDYIVVASKTCYRLFVLPVTCEHRAGNIIIRYCITSLETVNVKHYVFESKTALYRNLKASPKPNRDRVMYAMPFNSRAIHELETKRGDPFVKVISTISSGHLLQHFEIRLGKYYSTSWGHDGAVFVRDISFKDLVATVKMHHRSDLGVKRAYVDPSGTYVLTLGYDKTFNCTKIGDGSDSEVKQHLIEQMKSDKFALMFKRPTIGLDTAKTWIELYNIEKFQKEQLECQEERNAILQELEEISVLIRDLVTKNMEGPPSMRIDQLEFYLDAINFNKKKTENREQCKQLSAHFKAQIEAQNQVSKYVMKTYHEPMDVKGKVIRGISQNTMASIYVLLPPSEECIKRMAWVEEQRKIEEFLLLGCFFQPWLPMTKDTLKSILSYRPKFTKLDYNTLLSKIMLEEGTTQLTAESQAALTGCLTQNYIDRNPWHYKQRQLVSFYQCDLQSTITDQEVIKLKQHYNSLFNNVADAKIREMDNVRTRHARLRYMIKEFNYFSETKIDFDVEDPLWTQEEDINLILSVSDSEITAVPYVSPSDQAIIDAKLAEEERLQKAMAADDFREKALYMMMSGVLEVKWEDELKREIPMPKCMIEKRPNEYTDEDKRNIKEYEDKKVFLYNERERYKNMLEIEFNKICLSLRDTIRKFNQKLKDTVEYKMFMDSAMNQEQLRVLQMRWVQFNRIKINKKETAIKSKMEENERLNQDTMETVKRLNEVLNECRTNLEAMNAKEKVLEKAFRKDIQSLSTPVQEQALKVYRRRPKYNLRQATSNNIVIELAKCVLSQEVSMILPNDCIDFLKSLNHLDEYIGVPPSIDELTFRNICKHRRIRIECELKTKACQMQLTDGETIVAHHQKRFAMKKERNLKLAVELRKCKENFLYQINNIPVQIVLRKGLVEIPLSGDLMNDFTDAILVPKKEIEQINELIKKAGNKKIKTIQQNMAFRRRIITTEWYHKQLRMTINDLIEQLNDISASRLLRDMQVYLRGRAMGRKETESLEKEIEVLNTTFETHMRSRREKLKKLQKQLYSYQENNKALDQTIHEINIDVCALKLNLDPELNDIEREGLKKRFSTIIKRGDLVNKIQKNQSDILVLQTELELLRLRTYPTFKFKAEPALIYDSVYVFAVGLQTLEQSHTLKLSNLSCDKEQPWDGGLSLINYINSVEIKGLSGPIEFKEGRRIQFKLDLLKLKQPSLVKVGEWQPGNGVNITDRAAFFDPGTMNVTLVVTTILEMPYVMMHTAKNFTGNSRFYGFCIDILDRISQEVGFDYLLDLVPDRKYGARDPNTGLWNGMVLQLMQHKADLAVGSMTINYARESVIDFTKPFMNLGISILFKVPSSRQAKLFSFMNPLATNIWLYVLSAYVLVSITMFVVARFSPCEWQNPHPCEIDNELVKNQFSLANSFWFTIGTLMQQGSDLNPKATSTRIVGGIWWFFTLIIISSYTANLAAFLTVERMITPIENAEDLAAQTEIPYGTLESGSTMTFFRDSMIETYKKMWRFMENRKPSVFVPTYEEGIQKVLDGNYAFLMESTMLDYIVQRNCNLTQIGGPLDSKGYGIATPKGSPWRDKISLAILELQEKGEIQMLYDKWWKMTGDTCQRNDKGKESKANSLGVDNIGGVFVVLLCGLAFAVVIAIFEFCYNSKKNAFNEKRSASVPQQSLCSEMKSEFCFALRCSGSRQRPALRRKCSKCLSGVSYVPAVLDIPLNPPQPPTRAPPPMDHSPGLRRDPFEN